MRRFLGGVIVTLFVALGVACVVIYFGLFPLGADNSPGVLERLIAHAATDRYLARNAPRQENPFQPTSENLTEGARKYEAHCAVCHGGAAKRRSPLENKFSPAVPQLVDRVPHDPDAEFWLITKHGYRLTGMPAWDGILSDDEIWKIIAFVKHSDKLPPDAQALLAQASKTRHRRTFALRSLELTDRRIAAALTCGISAAISAHAADWRERYREPDPRTTRRTAAPRAGAPAPTASGKPSSSPATTRVKAPRRTRRNDGVPGYRAERRGIRSRWCAARFLVTRSRHTTRSP